MLRLFPWRRVAPSKFVILSLRCSGQLDSFISPRILSDANEKAAPAFLRPMFEGDKASLKPYIAAGRFQAFEGDPELALGIRAIAAPWHTLGHTAYSVESGGQKLLVWGDIVHVAAIQFPDPSVSVEYDTNAALAEATRKTFFAEAAQGGFWIGAAHISFPGLGHVGVLGTNFIWMPAEYTTRLTGQTRRDVTSARRLGMSAPGITRWAAR